MYSLKVKRNEVLLKNTFVPCIITLILKVMRLFAVYGHCARWWIWVRQDSVWFNRHACARIFCFVKLYCKIYLLPPICTRFTSMTSKSGTLTLQEWVVTFLPNYRGFWRVFGKLWLDKPSKGLHVMSISAGGVLDIAPDLKGVLLFEVLWKVLEIKKTSLGQNRLILYHSMSLCVINKNINNNGINCKSNTLIESV